MVARAKALESMWRSLWKPFAQFFPPHLDDSNKEILRQALRGAGYFQLTRYADKIASYFDREGDLEDLREDALFAYALAMPGETTRGRIRGMLRKIDSIAHLSSSEAELVMFALDERLRLLDSIRSSLPTQPKTKSRHRLRSQRRNRVVTIPARAAAARSTKNVTARDTWCNPDGRSTRRIEVVTAGKAGLLRQLGLISATALVVSNMIGMGIFTEPDSWRASSARPSWFWHLGGGRHLRVPGSDLLFRAGHEPSRAPAANTFI